MKRLVTYLTGGLEAALATYCFHEGMIALGILALLSFVLTIIFVVTED